MEELMARVRVLVRSKSSADSSVLTAEDLVMDLAAHTVKRGEKDIDLSAKEYSLLDNHLCSLPEDVSLRTDLRRKKLPILYCQASFSSSSLNKYSRFCIIIENSNDR